MQWLSQIVSTPPAIERDLHTRIAKNLFGLTEFSRRLDAVANLQGAAFVDAALQQLRIAVSVRGIPKALSGLKGVLVVANHPHGGLDALVLLRTVLEYRPEAKIVANSWLSGLTQMKDLFFLLDPRSCRSRRIDGLRGALRFLKSGGCLLVFPSAVVASRTNRGQAIDDTWSGDVARVAKAASSFVVPVGISGRNRRLFYVARRMSFTIGSSLLLRELLAAEGRRITCTFGRVFPPGELTLWDCDDLGGHWWSMAHALARNHSGSKRQGRTRV